MRSMVQGACLIFFLALASGAHAVDGVLEINQTCAVQSGCFSGDAAGFPVTIDGSVGGSYRLTSDLSVSDPAAHGIQTGAKDLTIDLNGFAIVGPGPGGASGNGILMHDGDAGYHNVEIRNGTVRNFGGDGIDGLLGGGSRHRVLGVRTVSNGGVGIKLGTLSVVEGCSAVSNFGTGIFVSGGSRVVGNISSFNFGDGITAAAASVVIGNTVAQNTSGTGLALGSDTGYAENVVTGSLTAVSGGVEIGMNLCDTDTICP